MERKRILIASDIHLCHIDWYSIPTEERMEAFIRDVIAEYEREPFEALLLLGDYSLDHWKWNIRGSWLNEGRSNTDRFVKKYLSRLAGYPFELRMIAGNHEQYGAELWKTFTSHARQEYYVCGDWLFILTDTYGGDLDPAFHSDGTYSGADTAFIRRVMAEHPGKKAVLCAHWFAPEQESADFRRLVREEDRIVCLFAGHNHLSCAVTLPEELGGKKMFCTGHYSYAGGGLPVQDCMWGFREVVLDGDTLNTGYITPANVLMPDGQTESYRHPYGIQDTDCVVFHGEKR